MCGLGTFILKNHAPRSFTPSTPLNVYFKGINRIPSRLHKHARGVRGVFIKRWHVQRLTATVSPSPTVSMLRSMRSSKCSFLLRESRIKEVTSPGAGRTTFPPHSTFKGNEEYFTPSEHLCTSVCAASTDVVDGDDAALPNQLQRPLVVVVIVGFIGINEHKVVGSGLACRYQLILGTKKTNSIPKSTST